MRTTHMQQGPRAWTAQQAWCQEITDPLFVQPPAPWCPSTKAKYRYAIGTQFHYPATLIRLLL